jgi:hypothetical protein
MFYSNQTGCTIFFFLENFLALHVSDVTAYIVRSTTVVYSHIFFFIILVCLFHGVGTGVGAVCRGQYQTLTKIIKKKPMAVHYSCAR